MTEFAHPDPTTWWKHRRRLAYASFVSLIGLAVVAWLMPSEQLAAAESLLISLAWVWGLVIGAYVGAAAMEDVARVRSGQRQARRSYSDRWE